MAQLVAHHTGSVGVRGSNPLSSTIISCLQVGSGSEAFCIGWPSGGEHTYAGAMTNSIVLNSDYTPELRDVSGDDSFLGEGDLLIDVTYSSLNYKDGMALGGDKSIVKTVPLIPGIDAVGTVVESESSRFDAGDEVILNGAGLGENRHGGFTPRLRIDSASTVALPAAFIAEQAGALGTAGFTAALSVDGLVRQGVKPDDGEILVTGSTGGVGSVSLHLLKQLGYTTVAVTGRREQHSEYLHGLGASDILNRSEFDGEGKPLQKGRWAGVVDSVGSHTLANAIAQTKWGGVVTACGLAQGADLPTTVLPFILRGVTLAGINSVDAPLELRKRAWDLLAEQMDPDVLEAMTSVVNVDDVIQAGTDLMDGKLAGRTAVRVS